jgi:hypothetical protein
MVKRKCEIQEMFAEIEKKIGDEIRWHFGLR